MKLVWSEPERGHYVAEGERSSYSVVVRSQDTAYRYRVLQMRQPGGQVTNRNETVSLEGAFARAQVWENG